MKITEVRIKLMNDPNDRLQAFCSITFDYCFVIRDLKIIQGTKGSFVAMPSRKLTDRCPRCEAKNHLRASYCNECGTKLDCDRALKDVSGRAKLYADIAHPINSECRELIQESVIRCFEEELIKSREPGYICTYDDHGEDNYARLSDEEYDDHILPISSHQKSDEGAIRRYDAPASRGETPHVTEARDPSPRTMQPAELDDEDDDFGEGVR